MKINIYILIILFLFSCDKKDTTHQQKTKQNTVKINQEYSEDLAIEGFIGSDEYVIHDKIEGYLNNDQLKDKVVIYSGFNNEPRTLMILLGKGNSYELIAKNEMILGPEYTAGNKSNFSEDIEMKDHKLSIDLNGGGGAKGNVLIEFAYTKNKLWLTNFSTFNQGAGEFLETKYDPASKLATIITTNTTKEEMPEKTKQNKLDYKNLEFSVFNNEELFRLILNE